MAEFTPINTQAEFDAAIADRLSQQKRNLTAKYEGWISPQDAETLKQGYEKTIGELNGRLKTAEDSTKSGTAQIAELQAKVKGYETDSVKTRIALEAGLPYEMARRLSGDTEDAIRKDAELLSGMMRGAKPVAPLAGEPNGRNDGRSAALAQLAHDLGGKT